jgi:choline monooxygenase
VPVLDKPFFLQRGWRDTQLRLMPNVCTHAWYPLVPGASRGERLVCAQHGRQFDGAGRVLSQPGFKTFRDCDQLAAFPTAEHGPLLYACLGKPRLPFAKLFAPVAASLGKLPLEKLERRAQAGELREVDGNWKQHAWNYMDKFHVQFIHKAPGGLADAIDLAGYKTELNDGAALQWAYAKDPEAGFDPALLPERFRDAAGRRVFALWWFIFPGLTLNFYPWGLSVNLYEPVPGRPEKTLFRWFAYSWDDAKFARRDELWLSGQVDAEDVEAMAQVRRGARSGFAPRGRFSPTEETGPHWFHRAVSLGLEKGTGT